MRKINKVGLYVRARLSHNKAGVMAMVMARGRGGWRGPTGIKGELEGNRGGERGSVRQWDPPRKEDKGRTWTGRDEGHGMLEIQRYMPHYEIWLRLRPWRSL